MDENLRFRIGRKRIGLFLMLFLFSGRIGGEEFTSPEKKKILDLLRPVVKTIMLAEENQAPDPVPTAPGAEGARPGRTPSAKGDEEGALYQICWGDTCWSIARRHGMTVQELTALNPGLDPEKIKSGDYLLVRRAAVANRGRSPRSIPPTTRRELSLFHPLQEARLTSGYGMRWGRMHRGIDLAAPAGTPVYAAASGKVVFSGWQKGYGLIVVVDHGSFQTKYAHNKENLVRVGDEVRRGQPIAKVGQTGNATGSHLHFELVIDGESVDPLRYL